MRLHMLGMFVIASFGASPSQAQTPPPQAQTNPAFREDFETGFRGGFRTKFVEQCLSGASRAAGTGYDLVAICACAADALLKAKSVDELSRLNSDPGYDAELKAITVACVRAHPPAHAPGA